MADGLYQHQIPPEKKVFEGGEKFRFRVKLKARCCPHVFQPCDVIHVRNQLSVNRVAVVTTDGKFRGCIHKIKVSSLRRCAIRI